VFGPGEDHKLDQASPYHKFEKQYKETGKVKVFENSENYLRDFVHVDQVCRTHVDFFDVEESGIWNVGTGNPTSFLEVALSIAPYHAIEFIPMPEILKKGYQEYTCADMTKTKLTLERYKK
jgi:ADP-L-glycero-D-manno-heptose 6-epimerase